MHTSQLALSLLPTLPAAAVCTTTVVAGWISTHSSDTIPTPYPITNAAMHTAVHVALPSGFNATALAAYEAAAAAAIDKSVVSEAASLAAAAVVGIAGVAGITPAEGVNITAGSQQMLVNITLTVSVTMPVNVNDTLRLVEPPANAGATAEANMTTEAAGECECWTILRPALPASLQLVHAEVQAPAVLGAGRIYIWVYSTLDSTCWRAIQLVNQTVAACCRCAGSVHCNPTC
jgi:hypothetical protein